MKSDIRRLRPVPGLLISIKIQCCHSAEPIRFLPYYLFGKQGKINGAKRVFGFGKQGKINGAKRVFGESRKDVQKGQGEYSLRARDRNTKTARAKFPDLTVLFLVPL